MRLPFWIKQKIFPGFHLCRILRSPPYLTLCWPQGSGARSSRLIRPRWPPMRWESKSETPIRLLLWKISLRWNLSSIRVIDTKAATNKMICSPVWQRSAASGMPVFKNSILPQSRRTQIYFIPVKLQAF